MTLFNRSDVDESNTRFGLPFESYGLKSIMLISIITFIISNITIAWFKTDIFERLFGLSLNGLKQGYFWTPITYGFLHETTSIFHILLNLLALFFVGRVLEPILGTKQFLSLYGTGILVGGLCWLMFHFQHSSVVLLGASGGVLGLIIFFCLLQPNEPISFLLFFVIPITLKPKVLGWTLVAIETLGFLFQELPAQYPSGVAYSAHLGGMLGALLFNKIYYKKKLLNYYDDKEEQSGFKTFKHYTSKLFTKTSKKVDNQQYTVNLSSRDELKQEVDKVLDKINTKGFGSLSSDEKKILDKAKDFLR